MVELIRNESRQWNITPASVSADGAVPFRYHSINEEAEIERVLDSIEFNRHNNYIVFGVQYSGLIRAIRKKMSSFSTMTLIEIAQDHRLLWDITEADAHELISDKRVVTLLGSEKEIISTLDGVFRDMMKIYNLKNTVFLSMPYFKCVHPHSYTKIAGALFERLNTIISSYGNDVEDTLHGMDNFTNTWPHLMQGQPIQQYKKALQGLPALIVGAGPSLDKNLDVIKAMQEKVIIFCADASYEKLLNHGIVPHVVSSVERVELTTKFFDNIPTRDDVVFMGPSIVRGETLEKFTRKIFTGRVGDGFFNDINRVLGFESIDIGGNVACVQFACAEALGCDPLIFVGVDLAYTDGKTHAEGIGTFFTEDVIEEYRTLTTRVRGQNGEYLETLDNFMHARVWLENKVMLNTDGTRFINASEGGALIEGMSHRPLSEVLESLKDSVVEKDVLTRVYEAYKNQKPQNARILTMSAIEYFNQMRRDFFSLSEMMKKSLEEIPEKKEKGRVEVLLTCRTRFDEFLAEHKALRFIIQPIWIAYYTEIHSYPIMLDTEAEQKLVVSTRRFYKGMVPVAEKIIESLDLYIESLETYSNNLRNEERTPNE